MNRLPNYVSRAWSGWALALVLVLSAFLQFNVVTRTTSGFPMVSDAADYFSYAYNLKNSGVYSNALSWTSESPPGGIKPDALRSPGYPLFLLAIPGLDATGAYLRRVAMVQALLAVASVWLVYLIAARILRPGWSHLAALATAISPHLANLSTYLLTETLFLFSLLAAVNISLWGMKSRRRSIVFLSGLLWGVCSLVRPTVLFLPLLFLLAAYLAPGMRQFRRSAGLVMLGFVLVQAPWVVRNSLSTLDESQGSLMVGTLHHGSYPDFMYQGRPETYGWPFRFDPASERAEQDIVSVLKDIGRRFHDHPLTYAKWYLLGKPGTFLSWGYIQGHDIFVFETTRSPYREDPLFIFFRAVALYAHWPFMLLGVSAAMIVFWRPRWLALDETALPAARLASAIVLYAIAFHIIVAPYPRYGVPFRPLLYILALAVSSRLFAARKSLRPAQDAVQHPAGHLPAR